MVESGKNLEKIIEKISILKNEIHQSGIAGLTNIHKHCENLIKDLLNIIYDLNLKNLNEETNNYPGLDLGDIGKSISFQVTADKTSEKVNYTLNKVLRFKHYVTFKTIKIFILGSKQGTYSIANIPDFKFDWQKDILDFDDLIKIVQNLDPQKIKQIVDLFDNELQYAINRFQDEVKIIQTKSLINIEESISKCNLKYYEHFSATLRFSGRNITVPVIFQTLSELQGNLLFKMFLQIFNPIFRKSSSSQEIIFKDVLRDKGVINHFGESILKISPNTITYEYAQYKNEATLMTNLDVEIKPLLALLMMSSRLFKGNKPQIEVHIDLSTNGELHYMNQPGNLFSVEHSMNSFILNPEIFQTSKVLHDLEIENIMDLMEEIIHGFSIKEAYPNTSKPFMQLDRTNQATALNYINTQLA